MRVPVETSLGVAVVLVIAGQVPDDEGLVTASRKKHVGTRQIPYSVAGYCR